MKDLLARGHQGGDGAAVKGVVQGDDGGTAFAILIKTVLSCQLDHTLVGLSAAVCKKRTAHTSTLAQSLRQLGRRFCVE